MFKDIKGQINPKQLAITITSATLVGVLTWVGTFLAGSSSLFGTVYGPVAAALGTLILTAIQSFNSGTTPNEK